MLNDSTCSFCSIHQEDTVHALWDYVDLHAIREPFLGWVRKDHPQVQLVAELIALIDQEPRQLELFAMVAWLFWCRRNKIRCNKPSLPLDKILEAAGYMLVEFQQKPRVQNLHNQQWGRANPRVRWSPPISNVIKVNFDGAMFKESNEAGIGILVRNQDGRVMVTLAEKIQQPA